ncbi:hypothetical protein CC78DRAFT_542595 [Lojkania enalia]|uniref:Uncharacterized protein n=1 Tax=Lojkania enalia TaxID=147567 RepID=A0A9P4N7F9_9PLEO|nr:hypothetical protein CC78DRAFT_542595 [Didymosphaeria enalia]
MGASAHNGDYCNELGCVLSRLGNLEGCAGSPVAEETFLLEDAIGRVAPVLLHYIGLWDAFDAVLEIRFCNQQGFKMVADKEIQSLFLDECKGYGGASSENERSEDKISDFKCVRLRLVEKEAKGKSTPHINVSYVDVDYVTDDESMYNNVDSDSDASSGIQVSPSAFDEDASSAKRSPTRDEEAFAREYIPRARTRERRLRRRTRLEDSSTRALSNNEFLSTEPVCRQVTYRDAQRAGIPAGYSCKH